MEKGNYNPYDDVEVIEDNDNIKIVKVLDLKSAQYFGSDFYGKNWDHHYSDGDLYFVISKIDDSLYSIFNDEDGSVIRNLNDYNEIVTVNDLKRSFLSSLKLLSPIIKGGKTYEFLKKVSKGYDPHWRDNGDEVLIDEIKFNEKNPYNSKVILVFEDDKIFLETLDLEDSDDVYVYRAFTGNYYRDRNYDTYSEQDRWKNGEYIEYGFNDDNKIKAHKVAIMYNPNLKSDNYKGVSEVLENHFSSIVDDLIFEYVSTWKDCIDETVKDIILDEVSKPFDKFGIKEKTRGYKFETTVGVLLHWYEDVENYKFNLSELLNKLIKLYDKKNRGQWSELEYEVDCQGWDDNIIQSYYSKSLDEMMDKAEDDDRFTNIEEYREVLTYVNEKYGVGKWITTKKDPDIIFAISSIDPKTNKILVSVYNNKKETQHDRLLDIDGLYQLDNQPELFNENRRVRKKFL